MDVVPDVELGPVGKREDADALAFVDAAVVEVPEFGPLILGVPLAEGVAEASRRAPWRAISLRRGARRRMPRRSRPRAGASSRARVFSRPQHFWVPRRNGIGAVVDGLLLVWTISLAPISAQKLVAELDHFLELVGGVDVQQGKRNRAGVEGLLRQAHHHRRVLADGIEHHRPLEFGGHFTDDVNALGFQGAQDGLGSRSGMGKRSGFVCDTFELQDTKSIMLKSIGLLVIARCAASGAGQPAISAERIREHTRFLASDLLEGRGRRARAAANSPPSISPPSSRWRARSRPARTATYFQKVPLVGIETQPDATLGAAVWGKGVDFRWGDDFVGYSQTQRPDTRFEGERGVRGARDHRAGIQVGRFQRRGCDRQGAGDVHQRAAVHRSEILRRAGADLLRPLDLQIRRGAAPRGARAASSSTRRRRPATGGTWCAIRGAGNRRS